MLYRILTEDKGNATAVTDIVAYAFGAFTCYSARGMWEGKSKLTLIIEVDTLGRDRLNEVRTVADKIKVLNSQDAVLVQQVETHSFLI